MRYNVGDFVSYHSGMLNDRRVYGVITDIAKTGTGMTKLSARWSLDKEEARTKKTGGKSFIFLERAANDIKLEDVLSWKKKIQK